jgi:hypothetical protein
MTKRFGLLLTIVFIVSLFLPTVVRAQEEGDKLQLTLIRNFGYGGFGKIQGNFTLRINEPPGELKSVLFYVDDAVVAIKNDAPFIYKFHTSEYSDGEHHMYAEGVLQDGKTLESNRLTKVFLSSDQAWSETQNLIGPILIGTAVLTLLGVGIPVLFGRKKTFVLGSYGPAGGAICPRCELPFSRSFFSPNLVYGKLVRCPHCGKISIQPRASRGKLQEAESRFSTLDGSGISAGEASDLRKLIEESRFED